MAKSVHRLVLVVTSLETAKVLERWQFDIVLTADKENDK